MPPWEDVEPLLRGEGLTTSFGGVATPSEALAAGVSIIGQKLRPVPAMTVAETIFPGREPVRSIGRVDFKRMTAMAADLPARLGFDIAPSSLMMDLTVAKTRLVGIAKAHSHDSQVIIMDAPTLALGAQEADQLFGAIGRLTSEGRGSSASRTA